MCVCTCVCVQTEELKAEIDVLSQNHDRQVDRKDAILQMLLRDVEVAEEQLSLFELLCCVLCFRGWKLEEMRVCVCVCMRVCVSV